jgi:hypothetical protein
MRIADAVQIHITLAHVNVLIHGKWAAVPRRDGDRSG